MGCRRTYLHTLIAHHIRDLSGAEFKIAAYLYHRLERRKQVSEILTSLPKLLVSVGAKPHPSYGN
jgi:hypothetical protein